MSASSRSMNLSALAAAVVLLLIAQVQCQGVWTRICENGQTVGWVGNHQGLLPRNYYGVSVSGRGQCLSSATGLTFDMISPPTTFNFPIAGRQLLCGTINGCPRTGPPSGSPTYAICDGSRVLATLVNGQLLPPAGMNAAPSGAGQCSRRAGGPWIFTLTASPSTFAFSYANQPTCGPGGVCPGANPSPLPFPSPSPSPSPFPSPSPISPPAQTTAKICSGQSVVAYIAGPNNMIYPANGMGSPSGQARCTGTTSIPDLQIDSVPSFPLGSNPYCAMADGTCARVA